MDLPLISVIVPIYNVAPYLCKCLDSLKGQTLREIEVICIDDGSTDNSGRIADEYASDEFPIFRVIHTENRGLSAARNRGIDESRAEWLMFVDSDDWVSEDFCRIPYEAAMEYGVDLVIFGAYRVTRWGRVKKPKLLQTPSGIMDEMTAHEFGSVVVWNKLYRASLFCSIRYPEGHVYEDVAITHKIVYLAGTIVGIQHYLYYHIYRKESITHVYTEKIVKDSFISNIERYKDLKERGYSEEKLKQGLCAAALDFLAFTPQSKDHLHNIAEKIVKSNYIFPRTCPVIKRIALIVWKANKRIFHFKIKLF